MLCQKCKQKNANTHLKSIINGKMTELNICSDCAAELGYANFLPSFNFNDILGGFLGSVDIPSAQKRCQVCGSSFEDISKHGQVGCMNCYEVFFDKLLPMIQRMHGTSVHKGKIPGSSALALVPKKIINESDNVSSKIDEKKNRLKEAIAEQRFEDAAKLRDEIKELEKNE